MAESSYRFLVGSNVEHKVKGVVSELDLKATREYIEGTKSMCRKVHPELAAVLMAELTSYYKKQTYYSVVRCSLDGYGRIKLLSQRYLAMGKIERLSALEGMLLPTKAFKPKDPLEREVLIKSLALFVKSYPEFRERVIVNKYITKEEVRNGF
jgi:hypothetical protein